MSMIYGGNSVTFPDGTTQNTSPSGMGFKNRIINGAMMIDQRNAGAAVTANNASNNTWSVDRWQGASETADGVYTMQQVASALSGFSASLKVTVTTADTSLGASQRYFLQQRIEGNNIADLSWGTANASAITLSFKVNSSVTGTFGGAIRNDAGDRSYPFTYTISAANTWETKSITIPGDTSGTWFTNTAIGMMVTWGLGVGSSLSGTANTWASTNYWSATGATNLMATNGATFYITGVQLEKGSTATSFDYRPYGTELALCQRYYYQVGGNSFVGTAAYTAVAGGMLWNTGAGDFMIPFKVSMRTAPTTINSNMAGQYTTTPAVITSLDSVDGTTPNAAFVRANFGNSWPAGGAVNMNSSNSTTAYIAFSAEL